MRIDESAVNKKFVESINKKSVLWLANTNVSPKNSTPLSDAKSYIANTLKYKASLSKNIEKGAYITSN